MPNITAPALTFPSKAFPAQQAGVPAGAVGELGFSYLLGKYAAMVKAQKVFYTSTIITAPVIFSTAAQNGPVLWNRPASGFEAHILAVGVGSPTTASGVAGSIGIATTTQPTAPTLGGTAAAIVAVNAYAGGPVSGLGQIASGSAGNAVTVIVLPAPIFLPLVAVNTGAITSPVITQGWVDVNGAAIVAPGTAGYICASATLTSGVFTLGILWAELPV